MEMRLKKMIIINFKGIKKLEIDFEKTTDIFGDNGECKTTVFDALTWTLTDKDSLGRTVFDIKPLDEKGMPVRMVDVEVTLFMEIDYKLVEIKKVLHEKYTKKRGELIPEFDGNENLYYWNEAPLQLKQFQAKISELINENVLRLITNPLYFNSLKWQERRAILETIGGQVTDKDLMVLYPEFKALLEEMSGKSLKEFKDMIAAKKKKLKEDLKQIPHRIDETTNQMPKSEDFDNLRFSISENKKKLADIDDQLLDSSKIMEAAYEDKRNRQNFLHQLKTKADKIKNDIRSSFSKKSLELKYSIGEKERTLDAKQKNLYARNKSIETATIEIAQLNQQKQNAIEEWEKVQGEELVFDPKKFECPSCQRPLDPEKIEASKKTLTENFNTDKEQRITEIENKGNRINLKIQESKTTLVELKGDVDLLNIEINDLQTQVASEKATHQKFLADADGEFNKELDESLEYKSINLQIQEVEIEVSKPVEETDNSSLKTQKQSLTLVTSSWEKKLYDEELIKRAKERIAELKEQESKFSQQLATLEGSEFMAEKFTKAKMETLVQNINNKFRYVTFKMFDVLGNGAEVEACETMVLSNDNKLVPFSNANNAARINAGLDIINTLCEHYNVFAPIFIDNRESVTKLIECGAQIINLFVWEGSRLSVGKPEYRQSYLAKVGKTQYELDEIFDSLKNAVA